MLRVKGLLNGLREFGFKRVWGFWRCGIWDMGYGIWDRPVFVAVIFNGICGV